MRLTVRFTKLVLASLLVLASSTALADGNSRFKVLGAEPIVGGARVKLRFLNEWGAPGVTERNKRVRLWLSTTQPELYGGVGVVTNGMYRPRGAKEYGVVDMCGRGVLRIDVNYERFGCNAGDRLWVSGCWLRSGHVWSEVWNRKTGFALLPAPKPAQVYLNSATQAELCELPGIGKSRAEQIIAQRKIAPIRDGKALEKLFGAQTAQALKGKVRYVIEAAE
ncbi:MAG: helix-hairpin-helix domain-containing protein [Deltaproteobacteria bacterium]|nr:helix-hairpin-helix domain-containing protein [Deltaproteobacteria bacterium]